MWVKWLCLLFPLTAHAQDVSLIDFLKSAWQKSPVVKGEPLLNRASDAFISSARGKYLPHFYIDGIDSTGFPASNNGLGEHGMVASPYRSGLAGGISVTQTIYDFGRISAALERAKANKGLAQAQLASDKFRFLVSAGQIYLACARAKSLRDADQSLLDWAVMNLKETERFTKTGQRSVIDNSLVRTEVDNLRLELDQLQLYQNSLKEQMRMFMATPGCQAIADSWRLQVPSDLQVQDPGVILAQAQIEVARAGYDEAKAAQLPAINAMASAADMERVRLVTRDDYSAGIGIVFPIWNGGEDARREEAYRSQTDYQKEALKAAELEYNVRMKDLHDQYARNEEALQVVDQNLQQVRKTMKLATQRYRHLEGPLIDVREAFAQLRSLETQRVNVASTLAGGALELGLMNSK